MTGRERLASYLRDQDVEFQTRTHPETFTAQETAQSEHVPGEMFMKVVMVEADGDLVMLCLPAPYEVDLDEVAEYLGADEAKLASEPDFSGLFHDCETGAMPPFGNLYEVPVYVDESLTQDDTVVFNACTHHETFEVDFDDFRRLVKPRIFSFAHMPEPVGG